MKFWISPDQYQGKKCLKNTKVFSKLWTHSWNVKIRHSELHRNQSNSDVVGVRAGSWFMNTSFSWHPEMRSPCDPCQWPSPVSTRLWKLTRFPKHGRFRHTAMSARFLAALHHPSVVGYPNKNSVQALLQNYSKRMNKGLSRVHPGNFLLSPASPLPIRPTEQNHCFGYLLRPFPCTHRDAANHCQMSWHLLRT